MNEIKQWQCGIPYLILYVINIHYRMSADLTVNASVLRPPVPELPKTRAQTWRAVLRKGRLSAGK